MSGLRYAALASLGALFVLALAWELVAAPLRPGGSWLALKAVPLLFPLRGMLAGRRYTFRWVPFLALAYLAEGAVRAWSEGEPVRALALAQCALAVALFLSSAFYARGART